MKGERENSAKMKMDNNKEIKGGTDMLLKIRFQIYEQQVRSDPQLPILTRERVLEEIARILENNSEKQRDMIEDLRNKLKIYVSLEESDDNSLTELSFYRDGLRARIPNLVMCNYILYISSETQLLYTILKKAGQVQRGEMDFGGVFDGEMVCEFGGNAIKELIEENEHQLEIYIKEEKYKGNYVVDRACQYLPQRYVEANVVRIFNKNGLGGYKIIPKQCRVDSSTLPVLKLRSQKRDSNADREIREWVDETIKVNEEGIDLKSYVQKEFTELQDKVYMTLKYVDGVKKTYFPCKEFHDFIIVYMIEVIVDGIKFWKEIDAELFDSWDIDIETLHAIACANTEKDYAPIFQSQPDALKGIKNNLFAGDMPQEDSGIYILHNEDEFYGVGILAYPEILDRIAEFLDDDFYFYSKNSIYSTIIACNKNFESSLLNAFRTWKPMVHKECAFSSYLHKYDRKLKKIETVYYIKN